MNIAVASYMVLLSSAIGCVVVAILKYKYCVSCFYARDFRPALLSIFICAAWALVAANGIWVKWGDPAARVLIEAHIMALLITATLFVLIYALTRAYLRRCYETKSEESPVYPPTCRINLMGTSESHASSSGSSKTQPSRR